MFFIELFETQKTIFEGLIFEMLFNILKST